MTLKIQCMSTVDGQRCECIAIYRGLCIRHYNYYNGRVRRKKTTWAAIEAAGLCLVQRRRRRGGP